MNRPWKIWLIFGLCSALLLGVMLWVSATIWRLQGAQAQAQSQAELEEKVRLALWRMDSALAPLIAQETARPSYAYSAFHAAERAYGKAYNKLNEGDVLVPSPLLSQVSSNILLYFQLEPQGQLSSPQVPQGNQRDLAEAQFTTHQRIEAASARLAELSRLLKQPASPELLRQARQATPTAQVPTSQLLADNGSTLFALAPPALPGDNSPGLNKSRSGQAWWDAAQKSTLSSSKQSGQLLRNDVELGARAQSVQQAVELNVYNNAGFNAPALNGANLAEDILRPVWLADTLLLIRRVNLQGRDLLQGAWMDWPLSRSWLLASVQDLLPGARLEPLRSTLQDPQARMLATLPVRLIPGPALASSSALGSPLLFALGLAWACVLLAGLAVALLLQGTLALSERRAAFVSAVTHELRTPLTTFKMYSEMLASDMVPQESQRRLYLAQLCTEAERLQHLVENVLAYAQLERGRARNRLETLSLEQLLQRVQPRLLQRAQQAGLTLQQTATPEALATCVRVDASAVEQILFNLVDNACKYAPANAQQSTLHLEAEAASGPLATVRVRDHGAGISAQAARRLFKPFSKSAPQAALSAPGVGLGLALCRRLARSQGGELRFQPAPGGGASFELRMPISAKSEHECT